MIFLWSFIIFALLTIRISSSIYKKIKRAQVRRTQSGYEAKMQKRVLNNETRNMIEVTKHYVILYM